MLYFNISSNLVFESRNSHSILLLLNVLMLLHASVCWPPKSGILEPWHTCKTYIGNISHTTAQLCTDFTSADKAEVAGNSLMRMSRLQPTTVRVQQEPALPGSVAKPQSALKESGRDTATCGALSVCNELFLSRCCEATLVFKETLSTGFV